MEVARNSLSMTWSRIRAAADEVYNQLSSVAASAIRKNPDRVDSDNPVVAVARAETQDLVASVETNPLVTTENVVAKCVSNSLSTDSFWPTPKYLLEKMTRKATRT